VCKFSDQHPTRISRIIIFIVQNDTKKERRYNDFHSNWAWHCTYCWYYHFIILCRLFYDRNVSVDRCKNQMLCFVFRSQCSSFNIYKCKTQPSNSLRLFFLFKYRRFGINMFRRLTEDHKNNKIVISQVSIS
jgi:hypothetical protein